MMMLASSSPLFATEIYPHSSQSKIKTEFGIDNFYHTLQTILDDDQQQETQHVYNNKMTHCYNKNKMICINQQQSNAQSQQHDAIATSPYRAGKSPVWHNRGVKCITPIISDACINSCNDDNKSISWNKGSSNNTAAETRKLLRSTSNTIVTNGRRRSSIQLSTITEEDE
ncbi:hypothetical protein BDA99DRAFT_585952 [Phascolomyces articulosus]|uniref:Uncharacterized protein n=1 Tax=Phascolomyces articulosus TaxID=60185 RepID=A0AAD5JVF4_9FUNG|nr:hypothetical protein BDA99DRAFT_585952 [Phascolomyces articulosus]